MTNINTFVWRIVWNFTHREDCKWKSTSISIHPSHQTCHMNNLVIFYGYFWQFWIKKNSSPHPLSLYGREQREHFTKYLILSSTEKKTVIQVRSNIRDVFFFSSFDELFVEIFTKLPCNVKNLIEMMLYLILTKTIPSRSDLPKAHLSSLINAHP